MTTTTAACADCSAGFDHCHGLLVLHADGSFECAEDGCTGFWERHDFRLFCDESDTGTTTDCRCHRAATQRQLSAA